MRYNQEFRFGASGLGNMAVKTSPATNAGGRICGDALDCRFDYGYYSTSPSTLPARKPRLPARTLYRKTRRFLTGKEQDAETGLYYYGARYLDPRAGRWLSGDPAVSEYIPSVPISEEARKRNGSLPGMGGVFNYANLHIYHYAGNNPVKYIDPDGRAQNDIIYGITNVIEKFTAFYNTLEGNFNYKDLVIVIDIVFGLINAYGIIMVIPLVLGVVLYKYVIKPYIIKPIIEVLEKIEIKIKLDEDKTVIFGFDENGKPGHKIEEDQPKPKERPEPIPSPPNETPGIKPIPPPPNETPRIKPLPPSPNEVLS